MHKNSGYEFIDCNGNKKYEYHIDECDSFSKMCGNEFGSNLSIRMMPCEKPVIMLGEDECILKQ